MLLALASLLSTLSVFGHSAEGRPLRVWHLGDPTSTKRVLVVGCIHGNECAGLAVTKLLVSRAGMAGEDLWVVQDLNPDGRRRGTRGNAHGVDLNRDFYKRTQPETRAAVALIRRIRPTVSIWFHQPQNLVRAWGPSVPAARRFSRLSGLRFRALRWPDGSASNWQNHAFPGTASFVAELAPGPLTRASATRLEQAVLHIAK